MKKCVLMLVFPALCSQIALADTIAQRFVSPDRSCRLAYEGAESGGNGFFYDVTGKEKKVAHRGYLRIGPIVNWMSNSIAEIQISEGSPSYHSYFYDCRAKRTSPSYSLPIAFEPTKRIIAALEQEEIAFFRLFSDKPFHRADAPGVGLMEYFGSCDAESVFEDPTLFRVKMTCENGGTIDLKIKVPD